MAWFRGSASANVLQSRVGKGRVSGRRGLGRGCYGGAPVPPARYQTGEPRTARSRGGPGPQPEPEGAERAGSADEGPRPGGGGGGARRKKAARTLLLRNQNSRRRNPGSRRVGPASWGAMLEEGRLGRSRDRDRVLGLATARLTGGGEGIQETEKDTDLWLPPARKTI